MEEIEKLAGQHPSGKPDEPYLGVIAGTEPKELDLAIRSGMVAGDLLREYLEFSEKSLSDFQEYTQKHGEDLKEIHGSTAERLQRLEGAYVKRGLAPPAYLMDITMAKVERAEASSEELGRATFGVVIDARIEEIERINAALSGKERTEKLAKDVRSRRNRLGMPAKVTSWFAGAIMLTGVGAGVSQIKLADKQSDPTVDEPVAKSELVFKTSAMVASSALIGVATAKVANKSQAKLAQKRARRKL